MKGHMFRIAHSATDDFLDLLRILGALEISLIKVDTRWNWEAAFEPPKTCTWPFYLILLANGK